jgi:hypothetical protein
VRSLIHPFVPSARATSSHNPTKSTQTDSLPNGSQLPTASSFAESFCRNLPSSGRILLPSWAHNSDSFLCQILVLTYALQLRDKSDFIPKLTPIANVFKLNLFNTYSLSPQSIGASVQIQTLGHLFPKLRSPMAGQNQVAQVNSIL